MNSAARTSSVEVVVVGRANVDLAVWVPFRPGPGRTAFGSELVTAPGGKGLNQAVAVARLGGRACPIGNAGDDPLGQLLTGTLADAGVEVAYFRLLPGIPTGAAIIEITPDRENFLTLALSPRTELTGDQVANALVQMDAPVVTVQLDMPAEPVTAALRASARPGTLRIGHLVPHSSLDREVLRRLDLFVVNQHEAAQVLGVPDVDPVAAAHRLRELGPAAVVVTAGARGAAYSHQVGSDMVSAAAVPVVDTTGAGDAFLGCLALNLARGVAIPAAVVEAVAVGSEAVQHPGAQLPAGRPSGRPSDSTAGAGGPQS